MTIQVLHERGVSNRAIGRQLGVDERTVRYRLQRAGEGRPDGRSEKVFRAEAVAGGIARFVEDAQSRGRGLNLQLLYERLVGDYDYTGSRAATPALTCDTKDSHAQRHHRLFT